MSESGTYSIYGCSLEDIGINPAGIAVVCGNDPLHACFAVQTLRERYPCAEIHAAAPRRAREALEKLPGGNIKLYDSVRAMADSPPDKSGNRSFDLAVFLSGSPFINDGALRRRRMSRLRAHYFLAHYLEPDVPRNLFAGSNNFWLVFTPEQWKKDASLSAAAGAFVKLQNFLISAAALIILAPLMKIRDALRGRGR